MNIHEEIELAKAKAESLFNKAKSEMRELTADEIVERDRLFSTINTAKSKLKDEVKQNFSQLHGALSGGPIVSKAQQEFDAGQSPDAKAARDKYNHYLLTGQKQQLQDLRDGNKFMITTGTDSGALIPVAVDVPDIVRRMYNSILAAILSRGYKPMNTPTAETLVIPVVDDSSVTGDNPSEDATSDTETDPTVTSLSLGATLFSSKSIWLSNTMIATVGYDLLAYLLPLLDKRVELAEDAAWITKLKAAASGSNIFTTASATAFTYAELVKLYHTCPPQFRSDAVWIVSDTFLQSLRLLVDSEGRPLFNMLDPLLNAGSIGYLMGCPVFISLNMGSLTANQIPAFFGSAECLKARYVTNRRIARYCDIPTFPDQVGFRLFENSDFAVNPAGVAFLKTAIS